MELPFILPSPVSHLLTLFVIFASISVPIGIQEMSDLQIKSRPIPRLFLLIFCHLAVLLQLLRGMDGDLPLDLCKVWLDYQMLRLVTLSCTNSTL